MWVTHIHVVLCARTTGCVGGGHAAWCVCWVIKMAPLSPAASPLFTTVLCTCKSCPKNVRNWVRALKQFKATNGGFDLRLHLRTCISPYMPKWAKPATFQCVLRVHASGFHWGCMESIRYPLASKEFPPLKTSIKNHRPFTPPLITLTYAPTYPSMAPLGKLSISNTVYV